MTTCEVEPLPTWRLLKTTLHSRPDVQYSPAHDLFQIVCDDKNLETVGELAILQQLSCAFDEKDEPHQTMYAKKLERCFKFGSRNPCDEQECTRIHICR